MGDQEPFINADGNYNFQRSMIGFIDISFIYSKTKLWHSPGTMEDIPFALGFERLELKCKINLPPPWHLQMQDTWTWTVCLESRLAGSQRMTEAIDVTLNYKYLSSRPEKINCHQGSEQCRHGWVSLALCKAQISTV